MWFKYEGEDVVIQTADLETTEGRTAVSFTDGRIGRHTQREQERDRNEKAGALKALGGIWIQ